MPDNIPAVDRVEQRRRQIMIRAASLLRRRGYGGFSVDDLCEVLKINKTTFYRYFASKEQLLFDLHVAHMDEVEQMLGEVIGSEGSAKDKLAAMIKGQVTLQQRPGVCSLTIPQLNFYTPKHRKALVKRRDEYEAAIRMLVQQGITEGTFRPCDPKVQSLLTLSMLNTVQNWYKEGAKYSVGEIAEQVVETIFAGLLSRGESKSHANGHREVVADGRVDLETLPSCVQCQPGLPAQ